MQWLQHLHPGHPGLAERKNEKKTITSVLPQDTVQLKTTRSKARYLLSMTKRSLNGSCMPNGGLLALPADIQCGCCCPLQCRNCGAVVPETIKMQGTAGAFGQTSMHRSRRKQAAPIRSCVDSGGHAQKQVGPSSAHPAQHKHDSKPPTCHRPCKMTASTVAWSAAAAKQQLPECLLPPCCHLAAHSPGIQPADRGRQQQAQQSSAQP